jgi:purine-cytosine permease-like protein
MKTRYFIFAFLGVLIASYLFLRIICNSIEIYKLKQKITLIERVDYLMIEDLIYHFGENWKDKVKINTF